MIIFISWGNIGCANNVKVVENNLICISPYYAYNYVICKDIHISINSKKYIIHKGFKTDLATIPRVLWPCVAPSHSSLMLASVVHDWLYTNTCILSRKDADKIFYELLLTQGVSKFRAKIMYYLVRMFGGMHYATCKKQG